MKHQLVDPYLLCNKLDKQTYVRSLRRKALRLPVIFVGILLMIIENAPRKRIENHRMLDRTWRWCKAQKDSVQIVIRRIHEYVHVPGVTNWVILPKTVWPTSMMIVCKLNFPRKVK